MHPNYDNRRFTGRPENLSKEKKQAWRITLSSLLVSFGVMYLVYGAMSNFAIRNATGIDSLNQIATLLLCGIVGVIVGFFLYGIQTVGLRQTLRDMRMIFTAPFKAVGEEAQKRQEAQTEAQAQRAAERTMERANYTPNEGDPSVFDVGIILWGDIVRTRELPPDIDSFRPFIGIVSPATLVDQEVVFLVYDSENHVRMKAGGTTTLKEGKNRIRANQNLALKKLDPPARGGRWHVVATLNDVPISLQRVDLTFTTEEIARRRLGADGEVDSRLAEMVGEADETDISLTELLGGEKK
ncbi:MAG TPA: hypothetical protein PLD47_07920 [Aggregatilineales bacterium]|nr:hypothetical protein [Anaerolineales bacterium]HRE47635.1 hypothetical protein [Aggregatilineales bacterium]